MECAPCKRSWWSHTHAPTRLYTFSTSAAKKGKDHVTFNRKCGVLNRRDDERENIDLYIIIRRSGERETKRKKTIKNIQMRSVCAVRRKEMRGPLWDKRNVCRLAEVLFKRISYIGSTPWRTYFSTVIWRHNEATWISTSEICGNVQRAKQKRRCDIKVNIAAEREEKSWHSISQEEDVGGMCCRFCYWRCTPGERSETDWHHLFPVNCFLDPPSFFRYRKKKKKTVSRARKHFERETKK